MVGVGDKVNLGVGVTVGGAMVDMGVGVTVGDVMVGEAMAGDAGITAGVWIDGAIGCVDVGDIQPSIKPISDKINMTRVSKIDFLTFSPLISDRLFNLTN